MKSGVQTGAAFMEGRSYIIGRNGDIRIDDPAVSRGHAEIRFTEGNIYLRDLKSTNGTYLAGGKNAGRISEGFVSPHQRVMIGSHIYTIRNLLASVGVYASYTRENGLRVKLTRPQKKFAAPQPLEKTPEDRKTPDAVV